MIIIKLPATICMYNHEITSMVRLRLSYNHWKIPDAINSILILRKTIRPIGETNGFDIKWQTQRNRSLFSVNRFTENVTPTSRRQNVWSFWTCGLSHVEKTHKVRPKHGAVFLSVNATVITWWPRYDPLMTRSPFLHVRSSNQIFSNLKSVCGLNCKRRSSMQDCRGVQYSRPYV